MFKVLKDWKGSPDGFTVIHYKAGETVNLHHSLVDVALNESWVEKHSVAAVENAVPAVKKRGRRIK